jgi:agmatine deiminase
MSFLRGFSCVILAGLAGSAALAQAQADSTTTIDQDEVLVDETLPPVLTRVREGGTPYDANASTKPYAIDLAGQHAGTQAPGAGILRSPAEYDPMRGVIYKYIPGHWHEVVVDCVRALTADPTHDDVAYVVVNSTSHQATATAQMIAAGADMSKVEFFVEPGNSVWLRDYGPHFIFQDETLAIVDSHYYPGRSLDNFVPTLLGDNHFLVPTYDIGLYYSGGNFLPGPSRSAFVSALIRLDNPTGAGFDDAFIAELYDQYQGIDTLHIMGQLPFTVDGTGHIDMWMYLVDEDTVIISEFKPGSNPTAIQVTNDAVPYMENLGFEVIRTPAWNAVHPDAGNTHWTYTNAYRVSNRIFIPTYGEGNASYLDEDADALAAWQAAAGPDIEIVPINCYDIIWAAGAIHCIVMQVPRYVELTPAGVVVAPLPGEIVASGTQYTLEWNITDTDNADLDHVDLYYSVDGGGAWTPIVAGFADSGAYQWTVPVAHTASALVKVVATAGDGDTVDAVSEPFVMADVTPSTYDFNMAPGVLCKGFGYRTSTWSQVDSVRMPVTSELPDLVTDAYSKIANSDAFGSDSDPNRYISPGLSGYESTHVFELTVFDDLAEIDQIEVLWEGYHDDCSQAELYIWDYVEGRWGDGHGLFGQNRFADNWAGNVDGRLRTLLQENFDRYIDVDGIMTLLLYGERSNYRSFHDYVKVSVISGAPGGDCPEDLTGDGYVGQDDLGVLLSAYGNDDGGDIDGDGDTDQADLGALLGMYGEDCP